jgi:hypothetical protein
MSGTGNFAAKGRALRLGTDPEPKSETLRGIYPEPKDEILHFIQDDRKAKGSGRQAKGSE